MTPCLGERRIEAYQQQHVKESDEPASIVAWDSPKAAGSPKLPARRFLRLLPSSKPLRRNLVVSVVGLI
jgi:hypothetical protein